MFGVNAVEMTKALIKPRIKVGSEYVHKGQNSDQVRKTFTKYNMRNRMLWLWEGRYFVKLVIEAESRYFYYILITKLAMNYWEVPEAEGV